MSGHSLPAAASRCPVVDGAPFDPLGAQECRDPMPWLRAAQHCAPVFFMPRYDMWCITRYEDVIAVLRDPVTFDRANSVHVFQHVLNPLDDQADLRAQRARNDELHIGGATVEAEILDQAHIEHVDRHASLDRGSTSRRSGNGHERTPRDSLS